MYQSLLLDMQVTAHHIGNRQNFSFKGMETSWLDVISSGHCRVTGAAWSKWRLQVARNADLRSRLLPAVKALEAKALWAAWAGWREGAAEKAAARSRLTAAVSTMQHTYLSRALQVQ